LEVIKSANLSQVDDAEYLGWIAYGRGDYLDATHWLKLSSEKTPAALWLKAKLARRSGNLADAVKAMTGAFEVLRDERAYADWAGTSQVADYYSGEDESGYVYRGEAPFWTLAQQASGDFAAFKLQRADFVQALDLLLKGEVWNDAAYVAERLLTTDELKRYVDQLPSVTSKASPPPKTFGWQKQISTTGRLRYLLGRRLVREGQYQQATNYLQSPYDQILRRSVDSLHAGANQSLSKNERGMALFRAAWIARYEGMEIMGTEMAPDGFTEEGEFPVPDLAKQRLTGKVEKITYDGEQPKSVSAALKANSEEARRLAKTKISPDIRFHYRLIAGQIAIKAAALLPTNTEETADVINRAGWWTKEQDEKVADRYFSLLRRRAGETTIGRAAIAHRWFVDLKGPWSSKLETEEKEIKKALGLHDPYEEEAEPTNSPSPTPLPNE
jgi:hypothetical protein